MGLLSSIFGDSSSSSSSASTQNTTETFEDNRVVSDSRDQSTRTSDSNNTSLSDSRNYATSLENSGNTYTTTTVVDQGLVAAASGMSKSALELAQKLGLQSMTGQESMAGKVVDTVSSVFDKAIGAVTTAQKNDVAAIQSAYGDQQAIASGQKNIMYATLAVLAVVVVTVGWKK